MTAAARPRRRARRGEGERLREEILVAAKDLLAETGDADAVSVRAVADRVGVSTPSLYLHFADKATLIDAVCDDVFAELGRHMDEAAASVEDPFESLRLRGMAYVRFALANPEHYRLVMMRMPGSDPGSGRWSADVLVADTTFSQLTDAVRRCTEAGVFTETQDPVLVATGLWAAAHGAVSLCLAKPGIAGDDAIVLCDYVIMTSGLGMALAGRIGEPGPEGPTAALSALFAPPVAPLT